MKVFFRLMVYGFLCLSAIVRGEDADKTFEPVAEILTRRCIGCHNSSDRKGDLDLTRSETLQAGGSSGAVVVPGDLEASLLWHFVSAGEMPPKQPLLASDIASIRKWIEAGAAWRGGPLDPFQFTTNERAGYDWWSLQPLRLPTPIDIQDEWIRSPIDRFILVRLRQASLTPSPSADRRSLIRRLHFDLCGLPPSPADVAAFLSDDHPLAYERLVERLLASPRYGERWARHWLDVARFGESQGFERDKLRTNSWRYRDWVIESWNRDMPYAEFARRQLAGDVLFPDQPDGIVATGFLVAGPYDEVGQTQQSQAMRRVVRQDELEDLIGTVGQTFLGLTANCARCHDHKFDPVRQVEYYRLGAALAGVKHGQREMPGSQHWMDIDSAARDWESRTQSLRSQVTRIEDGVRERLRAAKVPGTEFAPSDKELAEGLTDEERTERARLLFEIDHLRQLVERCKEAKVYAVTPEVPHDTHVLDRGNPAQPGAVAEPGGIAAVRGVDAEWHLATGSPDHERRRKLAEWITHDDNPLFWRVMANRLWHHHFGVGLVETPNDFGFNGGRPSHPELLDWLASELARSGGSIKHLQRQIVLSATYRQASLLRAEAAAVDADNRLLWRKTPSRLEAEVLRDTLLAIAGELETSMHGPGYYDFTTFTQNSQFYDMRDPVGASFQRRSIYRTLVRSGRSRMLDVFDCPDPSTKTPQRAVTTTPLQALSLWNNSFVLRMTERLADRARREAGEGVSEQVRHVWRQALARGPDEWESQVGGELVREHGLAALCRVIVNSNEFLYVD